jgi:hypothetical protein
MTERACSEGLTEALKALDEALQQAALIREESSFATRDRLAAVAALDGCINFISAHEPWFAADRARPLIELAVALLGLDNNSIEPIVQPQNRKAGEPVSEYADSFRGYAAAIMGGLMEHAGMGKDQAGAWVASRLKKRGYKNLTGIKIANWRKKAREDSNSFLGRRYAVVLGSPHWKDPGYADLLVEKLGSQFPRVPIKK